MYRIKLIKRLQLSCKVKIVLKEERMMASKENQKIAKQVFDAIGGKNNIVSTAHCATRLRLVVHDRTKVDEKKLEIGRAHV